MEKRGAQGAEEATEAGQIVANNGSRIRLRPEHKDHVWSYDFMLDRTADGRAFKILNVIDAYSRECLAIRVSRKIRDEGVIDLLFSLFVFRGIPAHIRSDNGPEFTAKVVRRWRNRLGVNTLFIEPGSPWEKGYIESFNGKLRDGLLNREIFTTLDEAKALIEAWRRGYNHRRIRYRVVHRSAEMCRNQPDAGGSTWNQSMMRSLDL